MVKEQFGATLIGQDLRKKINQIKMSDINLIDLSKSQIVSLALEEFYRQKVNKEPKNPSDIAPLVSRFVLNDLYHIQNNYSRGEVYAIG